MTGPTSESNYEPNNGNHLPPPGLPPPDPDRSPSDNPHIVSLESDEFQEMEVNVAFLPTSITGGPGHHYVFGRPQPIEGVQLTLDGNVVAGGRLRPLRLPPILMDLQTAEGLRDMLTQSLNYREMRKMVEDEGFVRIANIAHHRKGRRCVMCSEFADDSWPRSCLCGEGWIHAGVGEDGPGGEEWYLVCESCEEPRWE